jgi:hypothetical protein
MNDVPLMPGLCPLSPSLLDLIIGLELYGWSPYVYAGRLFLVQELGPYSRHWTSSIPGWIQRGLDVHGPALRTRARKLIRCTGLVLCHVG